MANGPSSENVLPRWLKPLVTQLTVGGRHFLTRPGVALPHVGALVQWAHFSKAYSKPRDSKILLQERSRSLKK